MNTFQYGVYYEDTDAGGVVYHANYLKFFERARTDFLKSFGILQANLAKENTLFVVRSCNIEYFSSAKLEDVLTITCKVAKIGKTSVEFLQETILHNKIITQATVKVVCVERKNNSFSAIKIPESIALALNKYLEN